MTTEQQTDDPWIPIGARPVSSGGRVSIPKDPYRYDYVWLQSGATVRVRLTEYDEEFEARVQQNGRVRVPKELRDEHEIRDGDTVRVSVRRPPVGGSE